MRYTFPSLQKVLLVFLILGPFLVPTVFGILSMFDGNMKPIPNPLGALIGMIFADMFGVFLWWYSTFFDGHNGWQITILPTTIAAISYWAFMATLTQKLEFKSKVMWVITNLIICACISGLLFYVISLTLNFGVARMPITSVFEKYGATTSMFLTAIVFNIGAILGLILALLAKSQPATNLRETPNSDR